MGNNGTTGSVPGQIDINGNGTTLIFDRSDDYTFGNLIIGLGTGSQLIKTGDGTLRLTQANTYAASTAH